MPPHGTTRRRHFLKFDCKFTAFTLLAFDRKLPARFTANFLDYGKPQPETAVFAVVGFVDGEKPVENFIKVFFGNSYARIGNGKLFAVQRHGYASALLIVTYRVAGQIAKKLGQQFVSA